eukprot:CAMPEP_0202726256 /NCGR_PEP_ID=MMETSP1385-20130828/184519_1 /ASSEMBLY_ACC=CAM_ASM_000861 /TAXON_ID=933848 /ORGANISM="Elphidium margaritaceum" /LENGTH=319 /DNA_ID=CAMNT_0049392473 /DNA_START=42 /DNA_END=1002 /DNA_ORIENTATION=-
MLSRSVRRARLAVSTSSTRSFFDYVRVANAVDGGKTVQDLEADMRKESDTKESASFQWNWLQWFQQNAPEKFMEYSSVKSQFQRWEQYLGERGVKTSKQIDFADYKRRIADPAFVDDLEVNYYVERDTVSSIQDMSTLNNWSQSAVLKAATADCDQLLSVDMSSIQDMSTLNNWSQSAVASFEEESTANDELLVRPLSDSDKQRQRETLENAEMYDEKMKLQSQELLKDFEQIDAERMMLGQESLLMQLAEHPQYAETLEDVYSAKISYLDYVMLPIYRDYVKREKLAHCQDEERRKVFLERFERGTQLTNGMDCTVVH